MITTLTRLIAPAIYRALGIDIFSKLSWLREVEGMPEAQRTAWRLERLNVLLEHCWENVPFYAEYWASHGVPRRPLAHLDELAVYPLVRRETFKANREQLVARNLALIPHKSGSTGGTTGAPLRYFHDLELHSLRYAFQLLGWGFSGYEFGDPVFIVSGGSLMPSRRSRRNAIRGWLERKRGLYCLQMDAAMADACYAVIVRQKPRFIVGYPSTISIMLRCLEGAGRRLEGIRAVITTAEMLQPQYRQTIEALCGAPVFDHYGFNDGGLLSYECERHSGFHYNDFESILESSGPEKFVGGELAITNLWNRSMPFVRYVNGDLITLADSPCPCGKKFPMIGSVRGRTADILTFSNGKNLTGPGVTLIFKEIPVDAWQVAQTGPLSLDVRLQTDRPVSPEHEALIRRILTHHLSPAVVVSINRVAELTLTKGGKLKPVISEWSDESALVGPLGNRPVNSIR